MGIVVNEADHSPDPSPYRGVDVSEEWSASLTTIPIVKE
jgi:hypothetical protein